MRRDRKSSLPKAKTSYRSRNAGQVEQSVVCGATNIKDEVSTFPCSLHAYGKCANDKETVESVKGCECSHVCVRILRVHNVVFMSGSMCVLHRYFTLKDTRTFV